MHRWILALAFAALSIPQASAAGVLTIDFDLPGTIVLDGPGAPGTNTSSSGIVTLSLTDVRA